MLGLTYLSNGVLTKLSASIMHIVIKASSGSKLTPKRMIWSYRMSITTRKSLNVSYASGSSNRSIGKFIFPYSPYGYYVFIQRLHKISVVAICGSLCQGYVRVTHEQQMLSLPALLEFIPFIPL